MSAALLALAPPTGASASTWATTSSNWAGYATSKPGTSFRHVSGTWVAPAAHCGSGARRYSAVWLGLGGLHTTSRALEQVGTEADCAGGKGYYSAWYEIVPAAPVKLGLTIRPGDTMSASVAVSAESGDDAGSSRSSRPHAVSPTRNSNGWQFCQPSAICSTK